MRRSLLVLSALALLGAVPLSAGAATGDPFRDQQWGLDAVRAEAAWPVSDGTGAVVAVVDTGVDLGHPDLAGQLVSNGADFVDTGGRCKTATRDGGNGKGNGNGKGGGSTEACADDGAQDENGHGTHVAGIIAAVTGNGVGVASVAPGARILPVRVLDEEGTGTTDQIAAGIRYAVAQDVEVINLSLGLLSGVDKVARVVGLLDEVYAAVDEAVAAGIVVVVAAGNDAFPLCAEPSGHPDVVCVGATDPNDLRSWYSNSDVTTTQHFVVAPGGAGLLFCADDIVSTYLRGKEQFCAEDGYEALAGTSMAAPHVAGVAALLAAGGVSGQAAVERITSTARDLGLPGHDPLYGYGIVDAAAAVGTG